MTTENPYTPPQANVAQQPGVAEIEKLDVSETWKKRFRVIHAAGGPALPRFKELSREERKPNVNFNILAFLFGAIYYLAKGMWRKAITLFLACFAAILALSVVLELMGWGALSNGLQFGAAAVFATRANIDYYKKMVLGDNGWW